MDKIIKKIYLTFCADESVPYIQTREDRRELNLYEKLEKTLKTEQVSMLEKLIDLCMDNAEVKRIRCFELGLKIGVRLAGGEADSVNL